MVAGSWSLESLELPLNFEHWPWSSKSRPSLDITHVLAKTARSMAEPKDNPLMEKIVSLCKRRGFVFQSSEIYGGLNGFWDYGPLGAELKRNVKELRWNAMTRQRDHFVGLEATIIMHPQIWKASGHVDTFSDMMVEDPLTNKRYRADQIEPQSGTAYYFDSAIEASIEVKIIRETLANAEAGGQMKAMLNSWPSIHSYLAK